MRPRIIAEHEVNDGLFTSRIFAKKVTTSGTLEQIERKISKRMNMNRRIAQMGMA